MPFWRIIIAVLSVFWLSATATYAATIAGTKIINQASISYIDANGTSLEVLSNTSSVSVIPLFQFELDASQRLNVSAGERVSFVHVLHNTGNIEAQFDVLVGSKVSQDETNELFNLFLYVDNDGNGVVDSSDTIVDGVLTLKADESLQLIATGIVPANAPSNSEFQLQVQATLINSELAAKTNVDRVTVLEKPELTVALSSDTSCDQKLEIGAPVSVTLSSANSSNVLPEAGSIFIDGALREGILLQFELPDHVALSANVVPHVMAYQAIPIVQSGVFHDEWMRVEHWNSSAHIDRIGLLVPAENFTRDERLGIEFSITVLAQGNDSSVELSATLDENADGKAEKHSNSICVDVGLPSAALEQVIRFVEPSKQLQRSDITPVFESDSHFEDAYIYALNGVSEQEGIALKVNENIEPVFKVKDDYSLALDGVYLELQASVPSQQLILNNEGIRHVLVKLSSNTTADYTHVLLRETALASSKYRSIRPILLSSDLRASGAYCPGGSSIETSEPSYDSFDDVCVLNSAIDDKLRVSFENTDTGETIDALASVEPVSRVFDSTTLMSVPGAKVTLMQFNSVVKHPVNAQDIVVISDEQGRFTLPQLPIGTGYGIVVQPPENFVFPSTVAKEKFNEIAVIDASYGFNGSQSNEVGRFSVFDADQTPIVNVPLDPINRDALLVLEKSVNAQMVEPGDVLIYSVQVSNNGNGALKNVAVIDTPAFGLHYVKGSATFGGVAIDDPKKLGDSQKENSAQDRIEKRTGTKATEADWYFSLLDLEAGESKLLQYRMRVGSAAQDGNGTNAAAANATTNSGLILATGQSKAVVDIQRNGVLSDAASVFGKVFIDSSCDHIQNKSEWPIAGVRLYLQDGSYVITDADGLYSVYGLEPGLHVIRVDGSTLPNGVTLKPLSVANGADPDSRFLQLSNADFHRADFAAFCPTQNAEQLFETLGLRSERLRNQTLMERAESYNPDSKAKLLDQRTRASSDGDLSNGWLDQSGSGEGHFDVASDISSSAANESVEINSAETGPAERSMGNPKELAKTINASQAKAGTWLWPSTNISRDGRFMVVVPAGIDPVLYVNDEAVAREQIGEQIVNRSERAQLLAWYGVKLKPGTNLVEVRAMDAFGNERVLSSSSFERPAAGVSLQLHAAENTLSADAGKSRLPIAIRILDKFGNPANGVYFVTIHSSGGKIIEPDLQKKEPGVQLRVENGRALVHLSSSEQTGSVSVNASVGTMTDSIEVLQVAYARPMIGVGLVDIGGQWNRVDGAEANLEKIADGFEHEQRVALFLKGRIKNDINMTLSYDSAKKDNYDVFKHLNPNEHYATYGDGSNRGFEAQSSSKLYVKLVKNRNSIMWGDYLTDNVSNKNDLARQQRSLTGLNAVIAKGDTQLQLYAAMQESQRSSEEIAGNGTALLYRLAGAPIANNSDIVERVVRDKNNLSLIIKSERLYRYSDYTIDYSTGVVYFNDVIPSFDENLNPVSVRFIYEKSTNIDAHAVAGLRLEHKINEYAKVNVSVSEDQNPLSGHRISGIQLRGQIRSSTAYSVSAAHQKHRLAEKGDGVAQRVQIEHQWQSAHSAASSLTWSIANESFDNAGAGISTGRELLKFVHRQGFSSSLKGELEANYDTSIDQEDQQVSAAFTLSKTYKDWSVEAGAKHVQNRVATQNYRFNTAIASVTKRFTLPNQKRGSIGIDYERDIKTAKRYRFGVRSNVQLLEKLSAYSNYELVSGFSSQSFLLGQGASRIFTMGMESPITRTTKLYSEYRFRKASQKQNLETASGVRGHYELEPGFSVSPAFEVINVIEGESSEDSIAVSLGLNDTRSTNGKISMQAEVRSTEHNRYFGFRGSVVQKLGLDWTGLIREEFTRRTPDVGQLSSRHRLSFGMARRPKKNNRYHSLYLANWKEDYGPEDGMDERSYMLSTHQNVQMNKHWVLSGRFGGKWQRTKFDSGDVDSQYVLSDFRSIFDFNRRWEIDIRAGWLSSGEFDDVRYSWGAGAAWLANRNLKLALHYNVIGFKEEDLDEQGYNARGLNFGLQFKFDEEWFQWLE